MLKTTPPHSLSHHPTTNIHTFFSFFNSHKKLPYLQGASQQSPPLFEDSTDGTMPKHMTRNGQCVCSNLIIMVLFIFNQSTFFSFPLLIFFRYRVMQKYRILFFKTCGWCLNISKGYLIKILWSHVLFLEKTSLTVAKPYINPHSWWSTPRVWSAPAKVETNTTHYLSDAFQTDKRIIWFDPYELSCLFILAFSHSLDWFYLSLTMDRMYWLIKFLHDCDKLHVVH